MAWIKVTALDDTLGLLNTDKIIGVCVEDYVIILSEEGTRSHVKESIEEIYAMVTQQNEVKTDSSKRDYIGSESVSTRGTR